MKQQIRFVCVMTVVAVILCIAATVPVLVLNELIGAFFDG